MEAEGNRSKGKKGRRARNTCLFVCLFIFTFVYFQGSQSMLKKGRKFSVHLYIFSVA